MPRLYAPVTPDELERLAKNASVRPELVFAVTPQVRDDLPNADEEEREHVMTQCAAAASRSNPIVVAVFDAPDQVVAEPGSPDLLGMCALTTDLGRSHLICLLVADAGVRVQDDADLELSWYDASELTVVRQLLGSV